ncbi:MAG: 4-(cytidine 5'-diphospho)-2-C-methyl-D-erythritol kinase [Spirochaetota bacterium]|nr:4-(cytidine 5'-diphospho)-2-C-methyl-D-erythritol kinase [Spirochaetota bacterium]
MNKLKILAPGKINLHLQITSKRDDGFHNLISIFQMVSLYDEMTIESTRSNKIIVNGNFDCSMENNLIYKAADWLKKTFTINYGFRITCNKNIPSGAGMGGGSSDAAATLIGINSLLKLNISDNVLQKGALKLGSDIPFFLGSATAIAEGRGEKLYPLKTRKDLILLICNTGLYSSTKEAFNMFQINSNKPDSMSINELSNSYLNLSPSKWTFQNSFSSYLLKIHPIYEEIINIFNNNGSEFSSITGTGSSVFGVFSDHKTANSAQMVLKDSNIITHKLKMLANRPEPVYN